MKHFIDINAFNGSELRSILDLAVDIKAKQKTGEVYLPFSGKQLAMVFEKPSMRTRVSFEVGINQLGGQAIMLANTGSRLGERESVSDTAKVLSRYVDIIMVRCFSHDSLKEMSEHATVPVINGLTDFSHPCQVMADILTLQEYRGDIAGKKIAWLGDGNNMTHSWIHAAKQLGFILHLATPADHQPSADVLAWAKEQGGEGEVIWCDNAAEAANGADLVTTDTWVSMGDSDDKRCEETFGAFRVDANVMQQAKADALFMHCLPAYRGQEVTAEVIDGSQSVVFDEAENRLHVQKAIMVFCSS